MGQAAARKSVDAGLESYRQQQFGRAIEHWQQAVEKISDPTDKFRVLGLLAMVSADVGAYRNMLTHCLAQMECAKALPPDDGEMRAESYLNLARSNVRLAEYSKAIDYCRHSLKHKVSDDRLPGFVRLCLGNAHYGLSQFAAAFEQLERARETALKCRDVILELQVNCSYARTYYILKDYNRASDHALKALDLCRQHGAPAKYQRATLVGLAAIQRKIGLVDEAQDACEQALSEARLSGDKTTEARALCCAADLLRDRGQIEESLQSYERALRLFSATHDRLLQTVALRGLAKCLERQADYGRAVTANVRALDLAQAIGNKILNYRIRRHLAHLYHIQCDSLSSDVQRAHVRLLREELGVICAVCGEEIGVNGVNVIEVVSSCGHFFHERCTKLMQTALPWDCLDSSAKAPRILGCPRCRKNIATPPIYV